ncbi:MAG: 16S rRNA (cytosine(1402)-N(4))-methyltransferase RsmH [Candidatus Aminicenantes bacterium]|nr:16S rRNA (cytosine(1402)-N(4))-methyltransferase RsmH [Candidatus Aminicenantes bacterium]
MNSHYPVMNNEVISVLRGSDGDLFLDCTVGMGGHASLILDEFPGSELIAIDADSESIEMAKTNMASYGDRVRFFLTRFTSVFEIEGVEWDRISGVLVDPGLSVYQIKSSGRGFSHSENSRLDMRKEIGKGISAHEVVNKFSEKELSEIFEKYGEIRNAKSFAKRIIERRLFGAIDTSEQLRKITEDFFGWRPKRGRTHPAARVFQALRIYVNDELEGISEFVETLSGRLKKGARIAFLTFHSLEDRMIKEVFRKLKNSGIVELIKPFPMKPSDEEVRENNPSRSAKLRAVAIL